MIHQQNRKYVKLVGRVSATNAATITSEQLDTRDWDYASIIIENSTSSAATTKPGTLRVTESDDTVLTNFAAIATLTGGTATGNFTIPNMETATSANVYAVLNIDLKARKRYLTVEISPTTTQTFTVIAELSRGKQNPTEAGDGVSGIVVNA